jgi:hypothetical protein
MNNQLNHNGASWKTLGKNGLPFKIDIDPKELLKNSRSINDCSMILACSANGGGISAKFDQ